MSKWIYSTLSASMCTSASVVIIRCLWLRSMPARTNDFKFGGLYMFDNFDDHNLHLSRWGYGRDEFSELSSYKLHLLGWIYGYESAELPRASNDNDAKF